MLATLALFSILVYGFAFLAADAKLFGCPVKDYNDNPTDVDYIRSCGTLPIRPIFLKLKFFRELLSCYFCMGVWTGSAAHAVLVLLAPYNVHILDSYILLSNTATGTAISFLIAAVIGGPVCYLADIMVQILENLATKLKG